MAPWFGDCLATAALKASSRRACLHASIQRHGVHVNFFQPSFKLKDKHREGAKIIKRCHGPRRPCDRALAHTGFDEVIRSRLCELRAVLDPIALLAKMHAAQTQLGFRVDRRPVRTDAAAAPAVDARPFRRN